MAINFKAFVEEFQRTNWQRPGHLAGGAEDAGAARDPGRRSRSPASSSTGRASSRSSRRAEQQEVKLKDEYVNKKKQAVNLDLHRQQLREIDTQFGALLKQLPNKSQMDALLVDINQAGLGRGLQFELFRPAPQRDRGASSTPSCRSR